MDLIVPNRQNAHPTELQLMPHTHIALRPATINDIRLKKEGDRASVRVQFVVGPNACDSVFIDIDPEKDAVEIFNDILTWAQAK